jgi:hypothetical protein
VGVERFWLIDNDSDDNATAFRPYVASDSFGLHNITGKRKQVVAHISIMF